jgi:hypothetical protein
MTNLQLYLAIGIPLLGNGMVITILILYINAKLEGVNSRLDTLGKNVDTLVQYMILHEGKIARLEERTGGAK